MQIILDDQGCLDYYAFNHGVRVEPLVSQSELHIDDRHEAPSGMVSITVRTPVLEASVIVEAALDDFHENYAIKVLDDFEITSDELDLAALLREAVNAWCDDVHNIQLPAEFEDASVETGRLLVILSRLERNQLKTKDLPDYLESVLTVTNWACTL